MVRAFVLGAGAVAGAVLLVLLGPRILPAAGEGGQAAPGLAPEAAPPAPPAAPLAPPAPPTAPAAAALAPIEDGSALYADGAGRFFVLRAGPEGLTLSAVYALRFDRARHLREPSKRAPHGFYLDDLGAAGAAALERARAGFLREAGSGAVDAEADQRAERWAREVLAAGDATLLVEALSDKRYSMRRAAAFVLGEAGFGEARPVLEEVLDEKTGEGAARARRILEGLPAGEPRER